MAVLGTGFVRGRRCTDTTSPWWYAPANPHAPTGPAWPKVSPRGSFTPLGVPTGQVEHRGPRGRGAAEIPGLALMPTQRGSISTWNRRQNENPTHARTHTRDGGRNGHGSGGPGTLEHSARGAAECLGSPPQSRVRSKRRICGPKRCACQRKRRICRTRGCIGIGPKRCRTRRR